MSSDRYMTGKVKELFIEDVMEFKANKLMEIKYIKEREIKDLLTKKDYDYINEQFYDEYYDRYMMIGERIFEIYDEKDSEIYGTTIVKNGDEYTFTSGFYDGSSCLSAEVQEELRLMLEK